MRFADVLADAATVRVPIAGADFGSLDPEAIEVATNVLGWPDGTIDPVALGTYVRAIEAAAGPDLSVLDRLTAQRALLASELDAVTEGWREEIRHQYAAGVTAAALAEVTGLSLARVNQLVTGARRR